MAIPGNIRAVFFDAVGTLLFPEPAAAVVYAEVGRRYGCPLDVDAIGARFRAAFVNEEAADFARRLQTSEERECNRWRAIVQQVLAGVSDPEACFQTLYHHFAQAAAWRCDSDVERVLEALAARGLVLGMASNYDQRLRRVVDGIAALRRLSTLVISSEVGWRKPAPEFFAALVHSVGVAPKEILYVGDDRANDFEGARAAGFLAVLFDPLANERSTGPRIARLAELL